VSIELAEQYLLSDVAGEMLSPEGIGLLERKIREHVREHANAPKLTGKPKPDAQIARKDAELEQLRSLVRSGALSPAVGQAAIDQAQQERAALVRVVPERVEKDSARIIRMLPKAAEVLRERLKAGNSGLRDPRSIIQARNVVFNMFGGRVPLRPGTPKLGEKPFLVARVGINRMVLLEAAASAANCVKSGSGESICHLLATIPRHRVSR
jgi:hypothetical protein